MPSEQPLRIEETPFREDLALEATSEYRKLSAFLELASGFNLAVARCNLPLLRERIIERLRQDVLSSGITVKRVNILDHEGVDLVSQLQRYIDPLSKSKTALMVTGIDALIYRSALPVLEKGGRPPFVAKLNFDRERIARDLSCAVVLWLETEALKLLLTNAPDLSQWVSARFDFGHAGAEFLITAPRLEFKPKDPVPIQSRSVRSQSKPLLDMLSALHEATSPEVLQEKLALLFTLADNYLHSSQRGLAREVLIEAVTLAAKLKDQRSHLKALLMLGGLYYTSSPKRAQETFSQALELAINLGDLASEGNSLRYLALINQRRGKPGDALEQFDRALDIFHHNGDKRAEAESLSFRGITYGSLRQYERAIEDFKHSIAISRSLGFGIIEAHALANLGLTLLWSGNRAEAIESLQSALRLARDKKIEDARLSASRALAWAYSEQSEWRLAFRYFEEALACARNLNNRKIEFEILDSIVAVSMSVGELDQATNTAHTSLELAIKRRQQKEELRAIEQLALISARKGELDVAVQYYQQALVIARHRNERRKELYLVEALATTYERMGYGSLALEYFEMTLRLALLLGVDPANVEREYPLPFLQLGGTTNALALYLPLLDGYRQVANRKQEAMAMWRMAALQSRQGQNRVARGYLQDSIHVSHSVEDLEFQASLLWSFSLFLHNIGEAAESIHCLKESVALVGQIKGRVAALRGVLHAWESAGTGLKSANVIS